MHSSRDPKVKAPYIKYNSVANLKKQAANFRSSELKDFTQNDTCALPGGCLCTRGSSPPRPGLMRVHEWQGRECGKKGGARPLVNEEVGVSNPVPVWNCWHLCFFSLHYVTGPVLRWISCKSPMQHIQHATSSLTSLIMDEEIVIQE